MILSPTIVVLTYKAGPNSGHLSGIQKSHHVLLPRVHCYESNESS